MKKKRLYSYINIITVMILCESETEEDLCKQVDQLIDMMFVQNK